MKRIIIRSDGRYTFHGIGYTEHDGYAGTMDNRMSFKLAEEIEKRNLKASESYQLEINGKIKGIFKN